MLDDIVEVEPRGECRLWLRFQDGAEGEVDLELALIFQGVFAPLPRPLPLCASTRSWERSAGPMTPTGIRWCSTPS